MKKPVMRALSLSLCALLTVGGASHAAASAGNKPLSTESASESGAAVNTKDETVYVLAGADGGVQRLIVSDWVQNALGSDRIDDVTGLTGIENVKGGEAFTMSGDSCVWDAQGNDVYYQGSIDKELPITVAVSYTLDGQPVAPEDMAGKSGRVSIRFDYTNNQYEMVDVGGKQEKLCVPFAVLTGLVLDNDAFTNVAVSNGKIINDGDRTIVVGFALPGLQDSLGLDKEDLELPDYVEVNADVAKFELESTLTVAANELFSGDNTQTEGFDGLEDLEADLDKLTDAMSQLLDGSSQLYDGLCALLDSSRELTAGIDQLAAGAGQLKEGASSLKTGAGQLQAGASSLHDGLDALAANNDTLNGAAAQVFQSLLKSADTQLSAAGVEAPELTVENYGQVLDGVIAAANGSPAGQQLTALKSSLDSYYGFYQGLQTYTAGVAQSAAGAGELDAGAAELQTGADSLSSGANELYGGITTMQESAPTLIDGVTRLRDGALALNDGLEEFNGQGVQKLVDAFSGDLGDLADRAEALHGLSGSYKSFSGISPDMDGQVKFIWRTGAITAQE